MKILIKTLIFHFLLSHFLTQKINGVFTLACSISAMMVREQIYLVPNI